jgi:predicted unusual protein kinase regulating ubiquinone biosynthesis (AarF/ABC1/UbiB family)
VPPVPWNAVEILLRQQLRQPLEQVFSSLDTEAAAAGSIRLGSGRLALLDCGMIGRLDPRPQPIVLELILAIVSLDAQRCAELTLELALPESPGGSLRGPAVSLAQLQRKYERLLQQYYTLSVAELDFSQLFSEILQAARRNQTRSAGSLGAAILLAQTHRFQVFWLSELLFSAASLLGLWLILSILRSGRLRG